MDAIPELRMERRGSDRETLSIPVRPPKNQQSEVKDIFEYMDAKSWTRIDGRDPDAMHGEMRLRPRASQHPGAPPYKPTLQTEGHFEKMDTNRWRRSRSCAQRDAAQTGSLSASWCAPLKTNIPNRRTFSNRWT